MNKPNKESSEKSVRLKLPISRNKEFRKLEIIERIKNNKPLPGISGDALALVLRKPQ